MPSVHPGLFSPASLRPGASVPRGGDGRDDEEYDPRRVVHGIALGLLLSLLAWAALALAFCRLA